MKWSETMELFERVVLHAEKGDLDVHEEEVAALRDVYDRLHAASNGWMSVLVVEHPDYVGHPVPS